MSTRNHFKEGMWESGMIPAETLVGPIGPLGQNFSMHGMMPMSSTNWGITWRSQIQARTSILDLLLLQLSQPLDLGLIAPPGLDLPV